jgi:hypothetical protein
MPLFPQTRERRASTRWYSPIKEKQTPTPDLGVPFLPDLQATNQTKKKNLYQ